MQFLRRKPQASMYPHRRTLREGGRCLTGVLG